MIKIIFIVLIFRFYVDSITDEAYSKYVDDTERNCPRNISVPAQIIECTRKQIQQTVRHYFRDNSYGKSKELLKYLELDTKTFEYKENKQLINWYKREIEKMHNENIFEKYAPPEYLKMLKQADSVKRASKLIQFNVKKIQKFYYEITKLNYKPFENIINEVNFIYDIEDLKKIIKVQEYTLNIMMLEQQNNFINLILKLMKKKKKKNELR